MNKLLKVRRISSTKGAHIRWTGNGRKWYGNTTAGKGLTDNELLAKFSESDWDVSETIIEHGNYHTCPRCRGTGYYCGGPCYRCYGESSRHWVSD